MFRSLLAFVAGIIGLAGPVLAASLLSCDLQMDGSADPAGDRLTVTVGFATGEDQIEVEVRALRLIDDRGTRVEAILSDVAETRDEQGRFRLRAVIPRGDATAVVKHEIIVPYRCLKLPVGTHRMGYEVRGVAGGEEVFRSATRVTVVEVTELPRTRSERQIPVREVIPERRTITAYVMKEGQLQPQAFEVERPRIRTIVRTELVDVEIPGGFHRREIDEVRRGEISAAEPTAMLGEFVPADKREIAFATNRNVALPNETDLVRFGDEIGAETIYGVCRVNIPIAHHVRGSLELPTLPWWRRDAEHHFLVESVALLTEQELLARASAKDVLLFVHGYATSMPIAVLRTAQLQHDIEFPGQAMAFSWPSQGRIDRYVRDEELALASVDALADVLEAIVERQTVSGGNLHLIAHSMGNQLLLRAIAKLELQNRLGVKPKPFGGVVLAAADVSPANFERCLPAVLKRASHVTYYYSLEDVALGVSARLHGTPRVGAHPVMVPGVDTINADNVNSRFYFTLGHSYYAASDPVLKDLRLCLSYQLTPSSRRPPLGRQSLLAGLPHWEFLLEEVSGEEVSEEP